MRIYLAALKKFDDKCYEYAESCVMVHRIFRPSLNESSRLFQGGQKVLPAHLHPVDSTIR